MLHQLHQIQTTVTDVSRDLHGDGKRPHPTHPTNLRVSASVWIIAGMLRSKNRRTGVMETTFLIWSTACWCTPVHVQSTSSFSNSVSGLHMSARRGNQRDKYVTMPRNRRSALRSVSVGMSTMAHTLFGSRRIPSADRICPRYAPSVP